MKSLKFVFSALLAVLLILAGTAPAFAISDGTDATESYPFMGAFKPAFPTPPGAGGNGCGVTLIDPLWAITAAHCSKNNLAQNDSPIGWNVQFGSLDVTDGGELASVERFFRLPASGEAWWGRDLMLLRFAEPVSQTPIPIAAATPATGTPARVLGWGNTSATPPAVYPAMLQEADVTMLGADVCADRSEGEICAGGGIQKTGNADSGGPLLVRDGTGWAIAGVLSGPEESNDIIAGVFTDVTRHADWIRTIMSTYESIPDDEVDLGTAGFPALNECESSIVRTSSSQDDDPALLLTNGHCVPNVDESMDMPAQGADIVDQKIDAPVTFTDAGGYGMATSRIDRLLFATMTGTDLALFRLESSFSDLEKKGARILHVATAPPKAGDAVTLMAADPFMGGPRECTIEAIVPTLREGGYDQHDALRMEEAERCISEPGFSGAALLAPDGKTIVGVNNTSNRDGEKCTVDNPCEVSESGEATVLHERPYGQQIVALNDCVAAGSVLDLDAPGCDLAATKDTAVIDTTSVIVAVAGVLAIGVIIWIVIARSRRGQAPEIGSPATLEEDEV